MPTSPFSTICCFAAVGCAFLGSAVGLGIFLAAAAVIEVFVNIALAGEE